MTLPFILFYPTGHSGIYSQKLFLVKIMQFHKPISYSQNKTKTSLYLNSIDEKSKQFVAPDLFQSTF